MNITDFLEQFGTEEKCENYLINIRWGSKGNVECPHCHCKKVYILNHRVPFKCSQCKKMFSVKTGTIFAESNIKLVKWYLAMYFISTSKKGMSSVELSEKIGVTQKTAWFMAHRLREACMNFMQVSGDVEMDETFIGGKEKNKHVNQRKGLKGLRGTQGKIPVMGAISRQDKQVVAYPVNNVTYDSVGMFIDKNVKKGSMLYADNCYAYDGHVALRVNHSKGEYVRGTITTNSIESFWAIIKRGYVGVYHQWSRKHLRRYINEFTYRFNHKNKDTIIQSIIHNTIGRRLTYKQLIGGY